jgi:hypothetical protein
MYCSCYRFARILTISLLQAGVIGNTEVGITCNECNDNSDCNLNGVCQDDGTCKCFDNIDGITFLGPHCEVRLKDECRTIVGGKLCCRCFLRVSLSLSLS